MKWIKGIGIALAVGLLIWGGFFVVGLIKSNEAHKINNAELRDELQSMATVLLQTNDEFAKFINVRFPELEAKLDSANINSKRIEKIIVQETIYVDTTTNKIDLSKTVEAIRKGIYIKEPFIEKRGCISISGYMEFDGEKLDLVFDNRKYENEAQEVVHVVNKQWKFLGLFKTRLFGKKQVKVTTFNECGSTKTYVLIKRKGKWRRK